MVVRGEKFSGNLVLVGVKGQRKFSGKVMKLFGQPGLRLYSSSSEFANVGSLDLLLATTISLIYCTKYTKMTLNLFFGKLANFSFCLFISK